MLFRRIKKKAVHLDLTELIDICNLSVPQKEPNWEKLEELEKFWPREKFNEKFGMLDDKGKKELIKQIIAERNCTKQDFTDFLSKQAFQGFDAHMLQFQLQASVLGRPDDLPKTFFEESFDQAHLGVITVWPVALFTSAGFRSFKIRNAYFLDDEIYKSLVEEFFRRFHTKKSFIKLLESFVKQHPNYTYFLPPKSPKAKRSVKSFLLNMGGIIAELSPLLIIGAFIFYFTNPWAIPDGYERIGDWDVSVTDESCAISHNGWAWDLEAYYHRDKPEFNGFSINGSPFNYSFWNVTRFAVDPEEVTVSYTKYWMAKTWNYRNSSHITLAENKDDEEGFDLRFRTVINFLRDISISPEVKATGYDYKTREPISGSMKFSSDGISEAIKKFISCTY